MTKHLEFSFTISDWNIVCDKQVSVDDWKNGELHWQLNAKNWDNFSPKLAFLPPLKRRRLSESARLFFESAWDLVGENPNIPVVFASKNGELNRNFALWQSLLQEGDVSPTSFSLSVHNALVGQWSEFRQVKAETNAIMARKDSLETALLEGYLLLNEGHERVLVSVVELPLSIQYNVSPMEREPFGYALSFVLEKGNQITLSLCTENNMVHLPQDNALEWVRNHHLNQSQWQTQSSTTGYWLWQKN